jgi:protein TonB
MKRLAAPLLVCLLVAPVALAQASSPDLAAVRALYLAADYEGALRLLAGSDAAEAEIERVEEYRALCLLALGRTSEAERSIERIFAYQPMYRADPAVVSPRMVVLVSDVRQRLLPVLARNLYGLARKNIEHKEYAAAVAQLTEVLAITDAVGPEAGIDDLRFLGEGFLAIARSQLTAASTARTPPTGSTMGSSGILSTEVYSDFLKMAEGQSVAARNAAGSAAPTRADDPVIVRPDIFSDADRIQPPVPVQRDVPKWTPPDAVAREGTHRGQVEVIVDERGGVEMASIAESVHAAYDAALLEAAQKWRYRPATRDGRPVRYRLLTPVVLRPPAQ